MQVFLNVTKVVIFLPIILKLKIFPGKKKGLQDSFDKGFNKHKEIKIHNVNRISVGKININSLRNKFEFLYEFVKRYIDILLITETKIDDPNFSVLH